MKKTRTGILAFCCCACALLAATAFSENVVSRPAGVIRIELGPATSVFMSIPFDAPDNTVRTVFTNQLSGVSCIIRKWDKVNQVYVESDLSSATTIEPGEGFVLENGSDETQTVFLAGCVVLDSEMSENLHPGMNLIAYPFSTRIDKDDVSLESDDDLLMGSGYWFELAGPDVEIWTEPRPYADSFPAAGGTPAIAGMVMNEAGDELTLTISCSGVAGELLDILHKDATPADKLITGSGWQIAELGIGSAGATEVAWADADSETRDPLNNIFVRYYLVGRGDIDTDEDGIPDARETFVHGTSPALSDTDGDGMPDGWEVAHGLDPTVDDAGGDLDSDGQTNLQEYQNGTDPSKPTNAVIWVDGVNGKNGNSGLSELDAKKTIHAAIKMATRGDTIMVKPGTYRGRVILPSGIKMISIGKVVIHNA